MHKLSLLYQSTKAMPETRNDIIIALGTICIVIQVLDMKRMEYINTSHTFIDALLFKTISHVPRFQLGFIF